MSGNLKPGWAEAAGREAGLAERGGGGNEAVTIRRPSNFIIGARKKALEVMRARATRNSHKTRRLDRALESDPEGEP